MTDQKPPEKLIKYYRCDEYSCDALLNNYLWASHPADFNDPFDCHIYSLNENSFNKEWLLETTSDWSHEWWTENKLLNRERYYDIYLRFVGIICFNEFEFANQDLLWVTIHNKRGLQLSSIKQFYLKA